MPNIATRDDWELARLELLAAEKEHSRRSDELAQQRQALPWVRVDERYVFATEHGPRTLEQLFERRPSSA